MKKQLDLSLILPCYNEERILRESVGRIAKTLDLTRLTYEIIFVDDTSRDNTKQLILEACNTYPHTQAMYHKINKGRGRTVTDGMNMAKGKVVGYIDIDLEVSPVYIPCLVDLILQNKADAVIGKRMYRTNIQSIPREILSFGYQWLSNRLIGTGNLDTESGYKFFNRKKILPILTLTRHPHWFWDTEIIVLGKRKGLRIMEIPVLFLRRFDKASSVRIIRDSIDYMKSLWAFRKRLAVLK